MSAPALLASLWWCAKLGFELFVEPISITDLADFIPDIFSPVAVVDVAMVAPNRLLQEFILSSQGEDHGLAVFQMA
jgi:hypothetical protein